MLHGARIRNLPGGGVEQGSCEIRPRVLSTSALRSVSPAVRSVLVKRLEQGAFDGTERKPCSR
jgi:hypothetical protein